jgi:alkane 1-monooxygenase
MSNATLNQAPITPAIPFWMSLTLLPLAALSAWLGGPFVLLVPFVAWYLLGAVDIAVGRDTSNLDPDTGKDTLFWYRLVTLIWAPLQFVTLFALIFYVSNADHLSSLERIGVFVGMGVVCGTIGINYAHELMHQSSRLERWMADWLMSMVLYSHFRSEHLLVHHRYVATPRDPVTARYGESFYRFYPRVLSACLQSAWRAEAERLTKTQKPIWHRSNPFWRYAILQLSMLALAALVGGWSGVGLFLVQTGIAIWQLELVNYVEHYALTRKHLGDGRYEHVQPRHSWNADQRLSNWLLINLQRHSDHHFKPNRRFPVLQTYDETEAPRLPFGYPVMTIAAMIPSVWRKLMHPRVKAWRAQYYPEIEDWRPYNKATNPLPT